MDSKLVGYRRVSIAKQGASGLGIEGQQAAIEQFSIRTGARILANYTEVESGKNADRPELAKAIAHAKRSKATLVIAKLDRLSRNVHFLSGLMESGVEFQVCDLPHANRLTIHILAAVAEFEAKQISERTKAALSAYKARGGRLGAALVGSRLTDQDKAKGRRLGNAKQAADAMAVYADLLPTIRQLRGDGLSLISIADHFNAGGQTTRRGKPFSPVQISRILSRSEATKG